MEWGQDAAAPKASFRRLIQYWAARAATIGAEKPTVREASDAGSGGAEERSHLHDLAAQSPSRGLEADSVSAAHISLFSLLIMGDRLGYHFDVGILGYIALVTVGQTYQIALSRVLQKDGLDTIVQPLPIGITLRLKGGFGVNYHDRIMNILVVIGIAHAPYEK